MRQLRILLDLETRSVCNIKDCGSYRLAEDPQSYPLCLGWKCKGDSFGRLWWFGQPYPKEWTEGRPTFVAHNVQFDRVFISRKMFRTDPDQWDDTMVRCRYYGIPASLENASSFLFGTHKDPRGEILVKATDGRGVCSLQRKGKRYFWNNNPKDLADLGEYCLQDVELLDRLDTEVPPLPEAERRAWLMTERMNDTGIPVDYQYIAEAARLVDLERQVTNEEIHALTGGAIKTSTQTKAIPKWCGEHGYPLTDCQESTVSEAMLDPKLPPNIRQVLYARQLGASAAVAKYPKALKRVCRDMRLRGELLHYGAHTGRYSSKGVQVQNGKRGTKGHFEGYRAAVAGGRGHTLSGWADLEYHLGSAVRSMIVPPPGYVLAVSDYAGIEARVVSWLVDDFEDLDRFRNKIDGYLLLAEDIYHTAPGSIGKKDPRRSVGKEARLAGQYQIGWKTYKKRLKTKWSVDISDAEAKNAITTFRAKFWRIKNSWSELEGAWRLACAGIPTTACKCRFEVVNNWMSVTAPNGRSLYYYAPLAGEHLSYVAIDRSQTRRHIYGGMTLENLAQWISGMVIKDDMLEVEQAVKVEQLDHAWSFSVHDEMIGIVLREHAERAIEITEGIMRTEKPWAPGLPLDAESGILEMYGKV